MSENPPTPGSQNPEPLPDVSNESNKKRRDFWSGFVLGIVGNFILVDIAYLALELLTPGQSGTFSVLIWGSVFARNIVVVSLIVSKNRRGVGLGILSSYAFVFFMVLVGGTCVSSMCNSIENL